MTAAELKAEFLNWCKERNESLTERPVRGIEDAIYILRKDVDALWFAIGRLIEIAETKEAERT